MTKGGCREDAARMLDLIAERFGVRDRDSGVQKAWPVLGCRVLASPSGESISSVADVLRVSQSRLIANYRSEGKPSGRLRVQLIDVEPPPAGVEMTVVTAQLVSDRTWRVELRAADDGCTSN